jgi:hypothetical protein
MWLRPGAVAAAVEGSCPWDDTLPRHAPGQGVRRLAVQSPGRFPAYFIMDRKFCTLDVACGLAYVEPGPVSSGQPGPGGSSGEGP